jgi:4-hydroxy-3-polyprenylbenzoate decarboxylase
MAFKDNRQFIAALEATGDAVRIEQEVDWDLEAGAIVRRTCELGGPAPLFEKIKDYPPGYRIFGASLASLRRWVVALGLNPGTSLKDIQAEYQRRVDHPIKPVMVKDAPCKHNIILGDKVDVFRFPAPMIHEGDGGRYIGTWHMIVAKDLDSDWTNWAMHRLMVVNGRYPGGPL